MWIKQSLVIVPALMLVFMAQSVFWVPGVERAANDPSRLNRLVWYMGTTPEDMNPHQSTSASDSSISSHLVEGLLRYDAHYEMEPRLSKHAAVHHEIKLLVPATVAQDALELAARARYGDSLAKLEVVEDFELKDGQEDEEAEAWNKVREDQALQGVVEVLADMRQVRLHLQAEIIEGQITSVVDPHVAKHLGEDLGVNLHAHLDGKEIAGSLAEEDLKRIAEALEVDADKEKVGEALKGALEAMGANTVAHSPVVEFQMRKGVYWTEGPFFDTPERTWMVLVDGEEAGYFRADTEEQVKQLVRRRMRLKDDAVLTTWQFEEYFYAEEDDPTSPWWGKGPEVTSRDVKITLDLLRNRDFASPRMSSWLDVEEVRTFEDDPHRLQVAYSRLYSPAIFQLNVGFLPYHHWNNTAWTAEAINKGRAPWDIGVSPENFNPLTALHAKSRDYSRRPSSIGAMVLYPLHGNVLPLWENGKLVRLMRNEFYWERKPAYKWIDYYIFNPQMGVETSEMVFNTGGIDLYSAQPHQVGRYEQQGDRFTLIQRQDTVYAYIGFNMDREPVSDKRVRKALAMALNVDDVIEYIVWGQGERISGPGYPVLPWYNHDYRFEYTWRTGEKAGQTEEMQFVPYSIAEARKLLEEAGYDYSSGVPVKDGQRLELTITMHTGNPIRRDIAILAQQEWGKLGIDVELEEHEWNVYLSQYIRPRNFTVCVLGWSGGLDFDKRQLWHSDYLPPTGLNFSGFKNEEADRAMEEILQVYDFETQLELSHRKFDLVADELPYIFLYSSLSTTVVDPRIAWRRDVGKPLRPLLHEDIANARMGFTFWMYELERMPERREWTEADFRD
jgi:ABC-type transport system substrate-binding protein